ncbi:hypothetical protein L6R50_12000 [Myxococcota bacterium]|nr:hypothetical protein [Myxococcota bacterium]
MAATSPTAAPRPRAYGAMIALSVTGLFAFALLLFVLVLEDLLGAWQLDQGGSAVLRRQDELRVGVVDSSLRRLWSPAVAEASVQNWREFLKGVGATATVLPANGQGGFDGVDDVDLVVVPTPEGLTSSERRALQHAISSGKGTLFAISSHMHDDQGILLQDTFWRRLLNLRSARIHTFDRRVFLPFEGGSPFLGSIPRGEGIYFTAGSKVVGMTFEADAAPIPPSPTVVAASPLPEDEGSPPGTPLYERIYGEEEGELPGVDRVQTRWGRIGEGRWVFFGFDPAGVPPDSPSRRPVSRMLVQSFRWLSSRPVFEVQPWPRGAGVAVMLAVDLTGGDTAPAEADLKLRRLDVPVTWFYGPDVFVRGAHTPREGGLAAPAGEIATRGLDRGLFRDRDWKDQERELVDAREQLVSLFREEDRDRVVDGLMPPGEAYDEDALRALHAAGYEYVYGGRDARGMVPDLRHLPAPFWRFWQKSPPVVLVPRTVEDDLGIALAAGDTDPWTITARYADAFERVEPIGGLFTITLHQEFFASPDAVPALEALVGRLKREGVWFATAADVARWWRRRGAVGVTLEAGANHRLVVRVTNGGTETVRDLALRVHLPEPADTTVLKLGHWRRSQLGRFELIHAPSAEHCDIIAPALEPGANEILYLEWR